jgi:predicted metal-dependent hydrolase
MTRPAGHARVREYHGLVQMRLPWSEPSKASRLRQLSIAGRDIPVTIARHHLARRYVVRVSADGSLRLTVPRGASLAGGFAFAARQADWIAREMDRFQERHAPWGNGSRMWFRGELVPITVTGSRATFGPEVVALRSPTDDVRTAVESRLRGIAADELPTRCKALARTAGVQVARVSVRNQRSRWGACSPGCVITLNWRLIQMPPSVSDYVIFHELVHVKHPNHSRRFWREVDRVCGWWRDAEKWLRKQGRELLP